MSLTGKTMFISGASRGIGLAIAKRVAADGANVALVAKTAEPHPKLDGTIYTAAKEIEDAGGQALPILGDVRDGESVESAVAQAVAQFGGIDICVNNASAINLGSITEVPLKRFDLMNGINVRGTYAVSQACIPHMKGRANPHILTLSPPLLLESKWLKPTAYMMAKYGMTLCGLGMAEELRADGIASNTLWPQHHGGHRRGAEPARRRRGDGARPQARGVLRRGLRDLQQAGARVHRQRRAVRGRAGRLRRHRPVGVRLRARLGTRRRPVGRDAEPPGYTGPTLANDDYRHALCELGVAVIVVGES